MATTDLIHLQAIRSKDILSGDSANLEVAKHFDGVSSPKLPTSDQLEFGSIALNIAPGYEVISIKNYNGDIVYLPFNIAQRILSLEVSQDDITNEFHTLSGTMLTLNEEASKELQAKLDEYSGVTKEFVEKYINEASAVWAAAISKLKSSIGLDEHGNANFFADYLSGKTLVETIETVNDRIDDETSDVERKILGVAAELTTYSVNIEANASDIQNLNDAVEQLSQDTAKDFDILNKSITTLSSQVVNSATTLSEQLRQDEEAIQTLQAQLGSNQNSTFEELSAKTTTEAIDYLYTQGRERDNTISGLTEVVFGNTEAIKKIEQEALANCQQLSGDTFDAIKNLDNKLVSKIDSLSAASISAVSGISNTFNDKLDTEAQARQEADKELTSNIGSLSGQVININSGITQLNEGLSDLGKGLSTTNESLKNTNNDLVEVTKVWAKDLAKLNSTLGFNGNGDYEPYSEDLSGKTVTDVIDTLQWQIEEQEKQLTKVDESIKELNTFISDGNIEAIKANAEAIKELSGQVSNNKNVLEDDFNKAINDLKSSVNQSIEESYQKSSNELETTSGNLLTQIDTLKTELLSTITESSGNCNATIDELQRNVVSIIDSVSGALDTRIDEKSSSLQSTIATTSSNLDTKIDRNTNNLQSTIETVSGDIVNKIETTEAKINLSINGVSGTTAKQFVQTEQLINEVSSTTQSLGDAYNQFVEGCNNEFTKTNANVASLQQELHDNELVESEALNKLKSELGFDVNGNYKPLYSDELSGTVVEALEYLNSQAKDYKADLEIEISKIQAELPKFSTEADEKIADLQGQVDNLSKSVNDGHTEVIEQHTKDIELLSGFVVSNSELIKNDLTESINDVKSIIATEADVLSGYVNTTNEALSNEFSDEISTVKNDFNTQLQLVSDSLKKDLASTNATIEAVSGITASQNATTHELIEAVSGNIITQLDNNKDDIETDINHLSKDLESKLNQSQVLIDTISGQVQDVDSKYLDTTDKLGQCIDKNNAEFNQRLDNDEKIKARAFTLWNSQLGFDLNGKYDPHSEELQGRTITNAIDCLYDYVTEVNDRIDQVNEVIKDTYSKHVERITYEQLRRRAQQELLEPGKIYIITNYQATVVPDYNLYTREAIRPSTATSNCGFYIIVQASSRGAIIENASVMYPDPNEEGHYFERCNLDAWEIKYSLFNDRARFDWATEDGFGVIYYMKDEYGNEAPYDFKNIKIGFGSVKPTFTFQNDEGVDISLNGDATSNIIKPYFVKEKQSINKIFFRQAEMHGNLFMGGCHHIYCWGDKLNGCLIGQGMSNKALNYSASNEIVGLSSPNDAAIVSEAVFE